MTKSQVDDADVTRMINFLFSRFFDDSVTAEARADAAYQVVRGIALMQRHRAGKPAVTQWRRAITAVSRMEGNAQFWLGDP